MSIRSLCPRKAGLRWPWKRSPGTNKRLHCVRWIFLKRAGRYAPMTTGIHASSFERIPQGIRTETLADGANHACQPSRRTAWLNWWKVSHWDERRTYLTYLGWNHPEYWWGLISWCTSRTNKVMQRTMAMDLDCSKFNLKHQSRKVRLHGCMWHTLLHSCMWHTKLYVKDCDASWLFVTSYK